MEVQHHDLDGGGVVSWVESVTLRLGALTVDLGQGGTVQVSNSFHNNIVMKNPAFLLYEMMNTHTLIRSE